MNVVGVWKLLALRIEDGDTGAVVTPWGEAPTGCLTYTESGHISAVLSASGREALGESVNGQEAQALAGRAQLYQTFHAYSGTYTVDGEVITHRVEVCSDPEWVGSQQVRIAQFDGEILTLSTPLLKSPNGNTYRNTLHWVRAN